MNEKKKVSDLLQEQRQESFFQQHVVANAPLIMAVFANIVVIIADVRAYDVVFRLTGSWWKALYASLACAIPFILWEIGWQYNHTTDGWRRTSLAMAGLAFGTSIFLGVADYLNFTGVWTDILLSGVVVTTGIHTVIGLLYYYNDPDVARSRHRRQALATMQDQELNARVAEELLKSGANLLTVIEALEKQFDPEDVERVLAIVQGKRAGDKPSQRRPQLPPRQQLPSHQQSVMSPAADTERAELRLDPTNRPRH